MNKLYASLFLSCILGTLITFQCAQYENPYLNQNNSKAVLKCIGVQEDGVISIFSRDSIAVEVYLREHLSRYSLRIKKNILWTDTTIEAASFSKNQTAFTFSMYDTGYQDIKLISYRIDGDSITDSVRIYVKTPLRQNSLQYKAGDSVELSTKPVSESVFYIWDLHDGSTVIKDYEPTTKFLAANDPASPIGELYATFRYKDVTYRSPSSFFIIEPSALSQIKITSTNKPVSGDTVFASTSTFQFIAKVSGITNFQSYTINDKNFERFSKNTDGSFLFFNTFHNLDSVSPLRIIIQIKDDADRTLTDTMFIQYKQDSSSIFIINPEKDSSTTNMQSISIFGGVNNPETGKSGAVFFYVNSNLQDGFSKVKNNSFFGTVKLDMGWNAVTLKLYEDTILQGNSIASRQIFVKFDPEAQDTLPPKIMYIRSGDSPLTEDTVIRTSPLQIYVGVLDESPIKSVTVNGIPATIVDSVTFGVLLPLKHVYNDLIITASDIFNQTTIDTLRNISYNHKPVLTCDFSKNQVIIDSTITWKIKVSDEDNDTLTVTALINGTIIQMKPDSTISWTPSEKDIGWQDISIQAYDNFEKTVITSSVNVLESSNSDVAVKWLTTADEIPDALIAGDDSLKCKLRVNPLSNLRPFTYTVFIPDLNKTIHNSTDSNLLWVPSIEDTGYHQIRFTVKDKKDSTDVFTDNISISPILAGLRFEKASFSGNESVRRVEFKILMSRKMNIPITVNYDINWDKTTAQKTDFSPSVKDSVTFYPGEQTKSIYLNIENDNNSEPDEQITLRLLKPSYKGYLETQSSCTYTILDDDYVTYSFATSQANGNESVRSYSVEVKLSSRSDSAITLLCEVDTSYSTVTSDDYSFQDKYKRLTFLPGQTTATIQFQINNNDAIIEPDEILAFRLRSESQNARPGNVVLFKYTINGSRSSVRINLDNPSFNDSEYQHDLQIQLRSSSFITSPISVYFEIDHSATTADSGKDFIIIQDSPIVFREGSWTQYVTVRILDDTLAEPTKKIVINFTKTSAGAILNSEATKTVITITDND